MTVLHAGSTHAYIGASPGCWALFGRLMLEPFGPDVTGQLLGDTYAAQHPGVPERRAAADDAADRGRRLQAWATFVWTAYGAHHADVRRWLDALLS